MTSPAEQAHVFLMMALCGAGLGAAYDTLGPMRRLSCVLADLLFGVIFAAGVILTALHLRAQVFRWYTLLGAAAGMSVYMGTFGAIVRRMTALAAKYVKKLSPKSGK